MGCRRFVPQGGVVKLTRRQAEASLVCVMDDVAVKPCVQSPLRRWRHGGALRRAREWCRLALWSLPLCTVQSSI